MRRTVLIVPDLLKMGDSDSPMRQKLPVLQRLTELGKLSRLGSMPAIDTPEALFLGMRPNEAQMRQGPLTISALAADPPDRSTHFHLSILSHTSGQLSSPTVLPTEKELEQILAVVPKLNTKLLTFVKGEALDHGLVWEDRGDMRTYSPSEVEQKPLQEVQPEGDGDKQLRMYIDDSLNLLSELELNARREDEGIPPLNILWPWGDGPRVSVPNLAIRRGEPAMVYSNSMRMAGLTRLVGYRHSDRHAFGTGTQTRLSKLAEQCLANELNIVCIDAPTQFRKNDQIEELHWFVREFDDVLLKPLAEDALKNVAAVTLVSPSTEGPGLTLKFQHKMDTQSWIPFDERAFEERTLPTTSVSDAVLAGLD